MSDVLNKLSLAEDAVEEASEYIVDLEEALLHIVAWSEAYPIDIFPEPDLVKARELLAAGGITLDAVASHCMRRVIEGAGKIAREALPKSLLSKER